MGQRNWVVIGREIYYGIITHARDEAPRECCGLIGSRSDGAQTRYPLYNQAHDPTREYFAAPEDIFRAMREMRMRRERLIAIYHSHPRGEARPSATDLAMAFYPEAVYLIAALEPETELRAFHLRSGTPVELSLQLKD